MSVKLERLPARPLRARDDRFRGALTLTSLRSVSLSRDARFPNPRRWRPSLRGRTVYTLFAPSRWSPRPGPVGNLNPRPFSTGLHATRSLT